MLFRAPARGRCDNSIVESGNVFGRVGGRDCRVHVAAQSQIQDIVVDAQVVCVPNWLLNRRKVGQIVGQRR
eukprot:502334-Rhodomonas_salina.1